MMPIQPSSDLPAGGNALTHWHDLQQILGFVHHRWIRQLHTSDEHSSRVGLRSTGQLTPVMVSEIAKQIYLLYYTNILLYVCMIICE